MRLAIVIRKRKVGWLWLAPPCGSFSALRNLDYGGPLRPKGCPEGDERNAEVRMGNRLWRRALALAWLAIRVGIPFFLEHPRNSKAWLLKETRKLMNHPSVKLYEVHWCGYEDEEREGLPNKKATRILCSGSWFGQIVRLCPGDHEHGPPLRGSRAKAAGAYPWGFCRAFADVVKEHHGSVAECRSVEGLQA